MARIFVRAFREGSFVEDGRVKLDVEFEEGESGALHVWTPRWADVATLASRAYETETANQGTYQYALGEARRQAEEAANSRDPDRRQTLAFRITALKWAAEAATARAPESGEIGQLSHYVLGLASRFEKALLLGGAFGPRQLQLVYCPECDWHIGDWAACCEACSLDPDLHL